MSSTNFYGLRDRPNIDETPYAFNHDLGHYLKTRNGIAKGNPISLDAPIMHIGYLKSDDCNSEFPWVKASGTLRNIGTSLWAGWWKFEEASGGIIDSTGNNADGTYNGALWRQAGKVGYCLGFDGVDDQVVIPDSDVLTLGANATVQAWVNPSVTSGNRVFISKWGSGGSGDDEYKLQIWPSNGGVEFHVSGSGGDKGVAFPETDLPISAWSLVSGVLDGAAAKCRIYLNGILKNEVSTGISLDRNTPQDLLIGNDVYDNIFVGLIDEVRIQNIALSTAEILSYYNGTK